MNKIYKPGFVVALLLLISFTSFSQSVTPATFNVAGGTYQNADSYFQFEWSLGEQSLTSAFATADSSLFLTHGVLQPCTDKVGKSPFIVYFEPQDFRLFPNPTKGRFEVDFFVRQTGRMEIQLTDASGKVLEKRTYAYDGCCRIEYFDLTAYQNGVYFVIATLYPSSGRPGDNLNVVRHSGFKVVKNAHR